MPDSAPKNIAIVGPLPPPFGGMANLTRQLASLLEADGTKVELIRTNMPYRPRWVEHVKGLRALFRLVSYFFVLFRILRHADLAHIMANSGWSWHLFAAPAIWVAWLLKVPAVVNYHGGEAEKFLARNIRSVRPSLKRADCIVVPSGYLQKVFERQNVETKVIPNIVNIERFKPDPKKVLRVDTPHIISCRNLEEIYDIETTLKAFKDIRSTFPDAKLTIAGEGPEKEKLQTLAEQLGIKSSVTFTGRLDPDEMAALYRSADLMLNTSRVDNMPGALLEAMAAGVPIVTTRAGGIGYIVKDNINGFLVPIGDWKRASDAVLTLLNDKALYSRFARDALSSIQTYSWTSVKRSWTRIYKSLLEAGS